MYDRFSVITPRKYGSTETYSLFTRNSPGFNGGVSFEINLKSDSFGMPCGRAASTICLFNGIAISFQEKSVSVLMMKNFREFLQEITGRRMKNGMALNPITRNEGHSKYVAISN